MILLSLLPVTGILYLVAVDSPIDKRGAIFLASIPRFWKEPSAVPTQ